MLKELDKKKIKEEELRDVLEHNEMPICYDGFEPSSHMHIAQGLFRTINVKCLV